MLHEYRVTLNGYEEDQRKHGHLTHLPLVPDEVFLLELNTCVGEPVQFKAISCISICEKTYFTEQGYHNTQALSRSGQFLQGNVPILTRSSLEQNKSKTNLLLTKM